MSDTVQISVHARADGQEGFLVRLVADGRATKFLCDTQEEAVLLATSIKEGIEVDGIPLSVFMPEESSVPLEDGR